MPLRSQMIYPNGGEVWCSPTSVAMLLAYWHERTNAPQLAPFAALDAVPNIAVPGGTIQRMKAMATGFSTQRLRPATAWMRM